jgi:undecaprenyl-diphosphatase
VVVKHTIALGLGALALFVLLAASLEQVWLVSSDRQGLIFFHSFASPLLTQITVAVSLLGSGWVVTPLALAAYLWLRRSAPSEAGWFFCAVAGGLVLFLAVVFAIDRPRPLLFDSPVSEPTASFPSGHAMNTTVAFLSFYLVLRRLHLAWRVWVWWVGLVVVILVSASRLYLQIHFPSDILAGVALAFAWVLLLGKFQKQSPK